MNPTLPKRSHRTDTYVGAAQTPGWSDRIGLFAVGISASATDRTRPNVGATVRARPFTLPTSERHRLAALRARSWVEPALAARYARDPAGVLSEYGVPAPAAALPPPPDDVLTVQSLEQPPSAAFTMCFTATLTSPPPKSRQPDGDRTG